ncbi:MAG: hypothetical protein Q7W45_00185 [Bacteroidota bacterium]|nr:hypothetical protein [Bacteroidota bacterium]MDP3146135.1 hypothetical protein [Bacteroidota bacterium]
MSNKVTNPKFEASDIYEGGDITQIKADELKGNIVAIRQLINSHNLAATESKKKDSEIQKLTAENEYLNTAPYVSIIAAIINLVGSLIIGLASEMAGNELQSSEGDISRKSILLLSTGVVLILLGSLATIFYPKARSWYNKDKKTI